MRRQYAEIETGVTLTGSLISLRYTRDETRLAPRPVSCVVAHKGHSRLYEKLKLSRRRTLWRKTNVSSEPEGIKKKKKKNAYVA